MAGKDLTEKLQKLLLDARAIATAAEGEKRDFTADERVKVANLLEEAGKVKGQIKQTEDDDALRKQIDEMGEGLDMVQTPSGLVVPAKRGRGKTIGEQFVAAEAFKEWYSHVAPSGQIPQSAKGLMSPPVQFKTLITGDSDTSAGAFVETDYTGIYEPLGRQELTIRDLISIRQTGSDLVEFVRQTAKITQAEVVPESNVTDYAGSTGEVEGLKPEAALGFEQVTAAVKTIAAWIPATKRALSDAAQIRGIIDQELRADLEEELEDQIINGTGTGNDFTGILNTSGILTQAWDTDLLTTLRKAITTARTTGRVTPTAWLFNPEDWETIDLLTDENGQYYFGGPTRMGVKQVWGKPVVESETVDQGTGLLGDWKKAILWDREQASIQVSDSHKDFFIRNMVAFLAEMRAAFGLSRPSGFVEVDLESGS